MPSDLNELQTKTYGPYQTKSQPRGTNEGNNPSRGPRKGQRRQRDQGIQKETTQWRAQPIGITQSAASLVLVQRSNDKQMPSRTMSNLKAQIDSGFPIEPRYGVNPCP
ncbi:unnamed protein product [Ilex paraguariensis]|uniref:Uncharacterized protein n=1 Tax=Ilex paraguariensis TaxID=185542 RepID=A0ABC8UK54_9AQUA